MRVERALVALLPFVVGASLGACSWDFGKIFDRDDPTVEQARHELEASVAHGDADLVAARLALEELLKFRCEGDGGVDLVIKLPNASLDLGLVVFRVAELVGQRFGDEEVDMGEATEAIAANRARELDCAQRLLMKLAGDPSTSKAMALRARYLLGNFAFLARRYKDAIARYDEVLVAYPARGNDPKEIGAPTDDDAVARDAAWNRAIALKRLEDEKDAGNDSGNDADSPPDTAPETDAGSDGNDADGRPDGADSGNDGGDGARDSRSEGSDGGDSGSSQDSASDGGQDAGADAAKPPPTTPKPAPTSSTGADLSELDRFEKKAPLNPDKPIKVIPVPKAYDK